jgi:hypothetical protein
MTPDDKLDTVLKLLDNDLPERETFTQIQKRVTFGISVKDLDLLLDKLAHDGHIEKEHLISGGVNINQFSYNISFNGRLFLSRGGYCSQTRQIKNNINLTVCKTFANVANAIVIISIAAFTAWVSWTSEEQEDVNKKNIFIITNRLNKQSATIDSLLHLTTTTKTESTK